MKLHHCLALFFCLLPLVQSVAVKKWHRYNQGEYIGQACYYSETSTANYCVDNGGWASYICQCTNNVSLGAYAVCLIEKTPTEKLRMQALDWLKEKCPNYSEQDVYDAYQNATMYLKNQTEPYSASVLNAFPIRYNETIYVNSLETFEIRYEVFNDGMFFGMGLCGYFALIILLATLFRVYKATGLDRILHLSTSFRFVRFLKSNFLVSSVYGKLCKDDHWLGAIPNRLESLVILGFVLLNILTLFFHYRSNGTRNVYWPSTYKQIVRYIADRTGYISLFMANLTWLFASRNNFLIWCTGWKHSTFLTYHKWVGRACVLHVLLHSIFLLWSSVVMGYLTSRQLQPYYRWGCVATVACSIMTIQGSSFFRKLSYEIFLVGHILLALFFLIGSWLHLAHSSMAFWFIPVIAIWVFDRVARITRMVLFGGYVKASVELHREDEILTVTIPNYNKRFYKFSPGQYAYVYFADMDSDWYFLWQSHPFTIVSCDESEGIKFFVKAKKGITNKIMKNMILRNLSKKTIRVAVEGPYGAINWSIKRTDNALLYSSSTGNAGPFMYAKQLLTLNKTANIKFYWSVQYMHSLEWFSKELQLLSQHSERVQIVVYLTKEDEYGDSDTESASSLLKPVSKHDYPAVEIRYGRMNVDEIVAQDIEECTKSSHISVVSCGHPKLCDDIRHVVKNKIMDNYQIDLHDDLQKW
ncbi:hypothetical protein ACO0QE_002307 [Hanseniaspora vineae]